MTTESLHHIIAVENELHTQEQLALASAAQWLQEQETAILAELSTRQARLAAEKEAAQQQARDRAERQAVERVRAAEQRATQLAGISDDVLCRMLSRHLVAIVTGRMP